MKRFFTILFVCLLGLLSHEKVFGQQIIQLFLEDFNEGNNTFTLNSGGPGSNTGTNQWEVNRLYNGNGIYPNTTPETKVLGAGKITYPDSNYLHIFDATAAPGVSNCNYNNNNTSDNFAYMTAGFCTLGLTNIHFTFFSLAQGTVNDYGRVYYSIDGGPWTQCGAAEYNLDSLWIYEDITLPVFSDQYSVQFGFRWTNQSAGGPNHMSWGIDDVEAVGDYDNTTNPVVITVPEVSPNPVCEAGNVTLTWHLSQPLCDGTYEIYMSNSGGTFNPPTDLGGFTIYAGDTTGSVYVSLPKLAGNCFKFRIDRTTPPPVITGVAGTVCLKVTACPNTITTLQPSVTFGPDTLCDKSVIDVPFYSTGTFNANNTYIAQLSDANGSFKNPQVLGSSPDPNTYDPSQGSPPGSVSGLVPTTPPGCNYYIRVISTSPAYTPPASAYFGPFCIRQCDVTTDSTHSIQVCIGDTVGANTEVYITINSWNKAVKYAAGNKFIVQLLKVSTYSVINTGGLGAYVGTNSTTIILHVPGLDSLENVLGILPGTYYLRFITTNSNGQSDTLGTLIHITIGYKDPEQPILNATDQNFNPDSIFCSGAIVYINVANYNFTSQYQWKTELNFGVAQPFLFDPPLGFTLNTQTRPGKYWFMVQEVNNGCLSPWSDTLWITVLTAPTAGITGTSPLCVNDTDIFKAAFQNDTYYAWSVSGNIAQRQIILKSNNEIKVVFDSAGIYTVLDTVVNSCGSATGAKKFTINPKPVVNLIPNFGICKGASGNLQALTNAIKIQWVGDSVTVGTTATVKVTPDTTTSYIFTGTNSFGCKIKDTLTVTVNPNPVIKLTATPITCYGLSNGAVTSIVQKGTPPYAYMWSNSSDSTAIVNVTSNKYFLTVTDANLCTDETSAIVNEPSPIGTGFLTTHVTYGQSDGTAIAQAYGGTTPYTYVWNTVPPQTGNEAIDLSPGTYSVIVTDSEGCSISAEVEVTYAPNQLFVPNAFSPNNDGINDDFIFSATNLNTAHVMIFDRWGEKIFESSSLEDKWNGTYKGVPVNVGVYVYVIEVSFLDGTKLTKSGNVTVLR